MARLRQGALADRAPNACDASSPAGRTHRNPTTKRASRNVRWRDSTACRPDRSGSSARNPSVSDRLVDVLTIGPRQPAGCAIYSAICAVIRWVSHGNPDGAAEKIRSLAVGVQKRAWWVSKQAARRTDKVGVHLPTIACGRPFRRRAWWSRWPGRDCRGSSSTRRWWFRTRRLCCPAPSQNRRRPCRSSRSPPPRSDRGSRTSDRDPRSSRTRCHRGPTGWSKHPSARRGACP